MDRLRSNHPNMRQCLSLIRRETAVGAALALFLTCHIWFSLWLTGGQFTPFSVAPQVSALVFDESAVYGPASAALWARGEFFADDLFEWRKHWFPLPIAHAVVAAPLYFLFGSPEAGWIAAHLLVAFLGILLLNRMLRSVFPRADLRAFALLAFLCLPFGPRNFLFWGAEATIQPNEITRFAHPGLSFWIFLATAATAHRALTEGRGARLLAGVLAGSLFFTYYFYCVAFFLGAALLFLWVDRSGKKALLEIGAVASGFAVLYLLLLHQESAARESLLPRLGGFSRSIHVPGLALALFSAAILFRLRRRVSDRRYHFLALLLSVLCGAGLGLSLQALTGYSPQHFHFWNRVIQPVSFLALLYAVGLWSQTRAHPLWVRPACLAGSLLIVALGAARAYCVARNTCALHNPHTPSYRVLVWLREHSPRDSVVASTENQFISLLPTVAARRSFVPLGQRTLAADSEIWTRFLAAGKMESVDLPTIRETFSYKPDEHLWASLAFQLVLAQRGISEEAQTRLAGLWRNLDVDREFRSRKVDYFILPRQAPTETLRRHFSQAERTYENELWQVWRVRPLLSASTTKVLTVAPEQE